MCVWFLLFDTGVYVLLCWLFVGSALLGFGWLFVSVFVVVCLAVDCVYTF